MKVLPRSRGPKVNKNDIRETTHFSFFSEMKTIALYVVVGFSGIIFVIADEQGNAGCDHRMYVQYLPTYVVVFSLFIHNYVCLLKVHLVLFLSVFYQRVVVMIGTVFTIMIQLQKYVVVCMPLL